MKDLELRAALKRHLLGIGAIDARTTVIEELGLRHGKARIDIAVVRGGIHGFELKSDQDSLARLPLQGAVYNDVLDKVTLVIAERHAARAHELAPAWWGLLIAKSGNTGISFVRVRHAKANPGQKPEAVAKLLWRPEALALLRRRKNAEGMERATRRMIYARIAACTPVAALRAHVTQQLQAREGWRVGERLA